MLARLIAIALFLLSLPTHAGHLLDLEVVNRATGEVLTTYQGDGQAYVAGNPGNRYSLRLINRSGERVLAVLSVDGVNVVTGETAAPQQSGYVLAPYERTEIAGWRKSLKEVAQFYFTALPDSYAARTDRPDNVGVIGVAVFREKARPQPPVLYPQAAPAPLAGAGKALPGTADMARAEGRALAEALRHSDERRVMNAESRYKAAERLGTGHGAREYAPIAYTEFERENASPNQIVKLRYDSRANLMARGIIPEPVPCPPEPQPFPGGFVPDPRG